MTVMKLKLLLIVFVILVFSGCAEKTIYRDVPVDVFVPVICKIEPVHCDFNLETDTEVITRLRTCIEDILKAVEACNNKEVLK